VLWRAAVAPDARGPGHLPPQDHVFHVTLDRRGRRFGGAPRRVQELAWKLMSEDLPDDQVVFELGRLCHLVADLCQPLHADGQQRNPEEPRIHPRYEQDADRDRSLATVAPLLRAPGEGPAGGWETHMEGLARAAALDYDAVCDAYQRGVGYAALGGVTRRGVERAVGETVALWRAILARRGRERRLRRDAARWAYLAVPLVLLWYAVRGRVSGEEARWPGGGEGIGDGPADRERRERRWRELSQRFALREEDG
jgi:hypothetical protein